ncbi:hypothetical protein [Streptomyces sp. NBC_01006]|uniref:hypothetical protein n=1 Tax=Streptomyces sp. NBC_01006 TaxID=2903716 RepID=UPI002F90F0EF|nr:hypothetical protein OG509_42495 [Streptomyces sp. NBC_01006]
MTLDSETDIWADVNTIRTPAYAEPTEDDVLALQDAVAEAADALAWQISERARAHRAADGQAPDRVVLSGDYQLALLHALRQTAGVVEKRAAAAAKVAGHQGASYARIGEAWGISRQSARVKWPDAVPSRADLPQPPVTVQHAGGTAAVLHHQGTDHWMFTAVAADGTHHTSAPDYPTSAAAADDAKSCLAEHTSTVAWSCAHCGGENGDAHPFTCGFCSTRRTD